MDVSVHVYALFPREIEIYCPLVLRTLVISRCVNSPFRLRARVTGVVVTVAAAASGLWPWLNLPLLSSFRASVGTA